MNNLAYQYHISGAVKSAVAYVLDGSVDGVSSNTVNGANSNTANLTLASSVPKVLYSETLYYEDCDSEGCTPQYNGAPSVVLFEKHLLAASSLVLIFFKKVGFSFAKFGKVTDSVQHSH